MKAMNEQKEIGKKNPKRCELTWSTLLLSRPQRKGNLSILEELYLNYDYNRHDRAE